MKCTLILLALILPAAAVAQPTQLALETCYQLAVEHYPLSRQRDLIRQSEAYSISNAAAGRLPQLGIYGQQTYQSDVTKVPVSIPGVEVPTISKNQYKAYGEVSVPLYDGGAIRQQKRSYEANARVDEQSLEVTLYTLRERVNQLFFGILLVDEQIRQNELLKSDIAIGLRKTEASIAGGVAFRSSADVLQAELLKADQRTVELTALRKQYATMLSLLIGTPVDDQTVLEKPQPPVLRAEVTRPELSLFTYQRQAVNLQARQITVKNLPRVNAFVQGGWGRPALNMLSNDAEGYYVAGVRLSWTLPSLYTKKKERAIIDNARKTIDLQQETFLLNTQLALAQQNAEAEKWQGLLASDNAIIALREQVKKSAAAQLENGVINSNDYLREVNAEDQARQNRIIHEIQLLNTQYAQQTTAGNP